MREVSLRQIDHLVNVAKPELLRPEDFPPSLAFSTSPFLMGVGGVTHHLSDCASVLRDIVRTSSVFVLVNVVASAGTVSALGIFPVKRFPFLVVVTSSYRYLRTKWRRSGKSPRRLSERGEGPLAGQVSPSAPLSLRLVSANFPASVFSYESVSARIARVCWGLQQGAAAILIESGEVALWVAAPRLSTSIDLLPCLSYGPRGHAKEGSSGPLSWSPVAALSHGRWRL